MSKGLSELEKQDVLGGPLHYLVQALEQERRTSPGHPAQPLPPANCTAAISENAQILRASKSILEEFFFFFAQIYVHVQRFITALFLRARD